jgi:hypothetical protein
MKTDNPNIVQITSYVSRERFRQLEDIGKEQERAIAYLIREALDKAFPKPSSKGKAPAKGRS